MAEPIELNSHEREIEDREKKLHRIIERSDKLREIADELEDARRHSRDKVLAELAECPLWQIWKLMCLVVALRSIDNYHGYLERVLQLKEGMDLEGELDRIHKNPLWAKISVWRKGG